MSHFQEETLTSHARAVRTESVHVGMPFSVALKAADNRIGNSRVSLRRKRRQHRHIALTAALEGGDGLHSVLEAWRHVIGGGFLLADFLFQFLFWILQQKGDPWHKGK